FSGFQGGLIKLLGPTGGYLIGFIFLSLCTGVVAQYAQNNISLEFLGMIIGLFLCYLLGTLWLSHQMHLGFFKALSVGVIPFIIPDLIKLILARSIGIKIKKINGDTTV
ncbi:MAG: biotin transporter BioY, partial [Lachnoanaerobaculum sp.]